MIWKRLVKDNPVVYENELATSYNNYGKLLRATKCYVEAEFEYKKAIVIREKLAGDYPEVYESDLAISYDNLIELLRETNRFAEAEEILKKVVKMQRNKKFV